MSQDQNQRDTRPPWRFNGPQGPVLVHPEARVLSIQSDVVYDRGTDPPKCLGPGCVIVFDVPGRSDDDPSVQQQVIVLIRAAEIEDQIQQRGGWH